MLGLAAATWNKLFRVQEGIILHGEEAGVDGNVADFPTGEGKSETLRLVH